LTKIQIVNQLHTTEARWFAVHTRSKCEKAVAQMFAKKNIHAYVPLVQSVKRYTRKVRHTEKPLISCYVFVKILKSEYVPVLETENVAGFVRFSKNIIAIPDEEINVLRRIVLENDIELEAIPGAVGIGDPVMITAGPLTGLSGRVVEVEGKKRFQVELERMGYSLLMTIDAQFLQKSSVNT
jgi:transcriptional antiterminator RfaH